ncbi:MAG: FAD-dependent oxidoreductase [Candidatus Eremiobacteraeota bacterium]|nr:FAD-dependent oxidoreductase [Candidatus Eremiobacteraeota bacterium]
MHAGVLLEMTKTLDFGQAVAEANRCLLCHDPPCSKGCPAGTDPGTFIRKLRMRNITGAIRTIKTNNILGGSCGILCPTCRLCEKECSATGIDRPIQIGQLQRFLVEHSYDIGFKVFPKQAPSGKKVAVVGSGPAGLSCAAELAKAGFAVTIFEKLAEPGGVMRYGVPTHRFDGTLLTREIGDIKDLGVTIKCSSPLEGEAGAEKLLEQGFEAVFLAPGLWGPVSLREGQGAAKGVLSSVEFLKSRRENGAAPDLLKGKAVAIIGGGSVAMDCAESALIMGARDVYLVYRRSFTQMPAEDAEKINALASGIHFILLAQPLDYVTDGAGALKALKIIRTRLGEPDASGRQKPVDIPGSEWLLEVDTCIEAIGQEPEKDSPLWYPSVKVSGKKLITADSATGKTSAKRIYAGGDVVRGPGLIVEAVNDGKTAAKAIIADLGSEV